MQDLKTDESVYAMVHQIHINKYDEYLSRLWSNDVHAELGVELYVTHPQFAVQKNTVHVTFAAMHSEPVPGF